MTVGDVEVSIRRPHTFSLSGVVVAGEPLGLQVKRSDTSSCLFVQRVLEDGVIAHWNLEAERDRKVAACDHIVSVNGASGDSRAMRELLAAGGSVDLGRPCTIDSSWRIASDASAVAARIVVARMASRAHCVWLGRASRRPIVRRGPALPASLSCARGRPRRLLGHGVL